jgi:hypothetical protein
MLKKRPNSKSVAPISMGETHFDVCLDRMAYFVRNFIIENAINGDNSQTNVTNKMLVITIGVLWFTVEAAKAMDGNSANIISSNSCAFILGKNALGCMDVVLW